MFNLVFVFRQSTENCPNIIFVIEDFDIGKTFENFKKIFSLELLRIFFYLHFELQKNCFSYVL